MRPLAIATLLLLCASAAPAASLRFVENPPQRFDFVDIPRLPAGFGRSEFTFGYSAHERPVFRPMGGQGSGAWEASIPEHGRPRFRVM